MLITLAKYMISYLHLDQSLPRIITSINTFSSFKLTVNYRQRHDVDVVAKENDVRN